LRADAAARGQVTLQAGWLEAGLGLLPLAQQLSPAGAWTLETELLTVRGVVPDQAARSRFWQQVTAHLPSQIQLNDLLTTPAQPLTEAQLKVQSELNQLFAQGIEFASGKASIATGSALTLTQAATLLNTAPAIQVEIGVHTDNQNEVAVALALSHARAVAIKKFLVMQGVNTDRLAVKGYGATQPIADHQTESGRQRNQRVELRVCNE
jgi:OmpA-OmpF porin, OOP family